MVLQSVYRFYFIGLLKKYSSGDSLFPLTQYSRKFICLFFFFSKVWVTHANAFYLLFFKIETNCKVYTVQYSINKLCVAIGFITAECWCSIERSPTCFKLHIYCMKSFLNDPTGLQLPRFLALQTGKGFFLKAIWRQKGSPAPQH